nr:MAG TPA: hypothetical protein [Caudoviricetes sp.]
MGLKSPWGYRGEILKTFGWTYDYLLWGISWLNVQTMINDLARPEQEEAKTDDEGNPISDDKPVIHRELKTKEDIKNYIKGII